MTHLKTCPVCDGARISLRYGGKPVRSEWRDERDFEVFGCEDCTHGLLNPMLDETSLPGIENYSVQLVILDLKQI